MIVDPWGEVLAGVDEGEGFAAADLDFERLAEIRTTLPAVKNRRPELFRNKDRVLTSASTLRAEDRRRDPTSG